MLLFFLDNCNRLKLVAHTLLYTRKKHVHTQINCFLRVYGRCESVCVINIAHCNNRGK